MNLFVNYGHVCHREFRYLVNMKWTFILVSYILPLQLLDTTVLCPIVSVTAYIVLTRPALLDSCALNIFFMRRCITGVAATPA